MSDISLWRRYVTFWGIVGLGFALAFGAAQHWEGHEYRWVFTGVGFLVGSGVAGFFTWFFTREPE